MLCNSAARPSQAAAAASIGPGPGPVYIRPELISGGNNPKSIIFKPLVGSAAAAAARHRCRYTKQRGRQLLSLSIRWSHGNGAGLPITAGSDLSYDGLVGDTYVAFDLPAAAHGRACSEPHFG